MRAIARGRLTCVQLRHGDLSDPDRLKQTQIVPLILSLLRLAFDALEVDPFRKVAVSVGAERIVAVRPPGEQGVANGCVLGRVGLQRNDQELST